MWSWLTGRSSTSPRTTSSKTAVNKIVTTTPEQVDRSRCYSKKDPISNNDILPGDDVVVIGEGSDIRCYKLESLYDWYEKCRQAGGDCTRAPHNLNYIIPPAIIKNMCETYDKKYTTVVKNVSTGSSKSNYTLEIKRSALDMPSSADPHSSIIKRNFSVVTIYEKSGKVGWRLGVFPMWIEACSSEFIDLVEQLWKVDRLAIFDKTRPAWCCTLPLIWSRDYTSTLVWADPNASKWIRELTELAKHVLKMSREDYVTYVSTITQRISNTD